MLLPTASKALGKVFSMKTIAAFAIFPTPASAVAYPGSHPGKGATEAVTPGAAPGVAPGASPRSARAESVAPPRPRATLNPVREDAKGSLESQSEARGGGVQDGGACRGKQGQEQAQAEHVSNQVGCAAADDQVDSFVDFLCRKTTQQLSA